MVSRLREARRQEGLTQEAVAAELGVARTTIVAIEKGERAVRPDELVALARIYRRPLNELLRSEPASKALAAQFRLALDRVRSRWSPELDRSVAELERLADDYAELERVVAAQRFERLPPPYEIAGLSASEAGAEVAAAERNRLGLGDGPVLGLRDLLAEGVGVRVFAMTLPSRVAALFAYDPQLGSLVAFNRAHPGERQRWSLAHEYGHLLTSRDRAEVTVLHAYQRLPESERFADSFAQNFLMPEQGIRRRFNDLRRGRAAGPTPADLLRLATSYEVSLQALTLRLEEFRLLRAGTWNYLVEVGFKVGEARRLLDLVGLAPDKRLLPLRYEQLALEALRRDLITEVQFARFLREDVVGARKRARELEERTGLAQDGTSEQLELDLGGSVLPAASR